MLAKRNKRYTIVDLFAGVGGLSLGFKTLGFDVVFANDNDTDASRTFMRNHPKTKFHIGDIKDLDKKQIKQYIGNKKIDVLVGGIPCQSFSMVGYRTTKKEA